MLKVVFNKDGSIRQYQLPTYVVKGSSGEIDALRLEVAVNDVDLDDYIVQAHFKLPNGSTNSIYLGNTLDNLDVYGVGYPNGKYGYLTAAQTYYEGIVEASIVITSSLDTSTVLYTFPFRITVNPSTYNPQNDDELITHAQYYNLLSYIEGINAKLSKVSKSWTIDTNEQEPMEHNFVANKYKRIDGTPIATWEDFTNYIGGDDFSNGSFASQELELDINPEYIIDYLTKTVVRYTDMKSGDMVFLYETNEYPDRYRFGGVFLAFDASKIGTLPYFEVDSANNNVNSFIESNNLINKPFVLYYKPNATRFIALFFEEDDDVYTYTLKSTEGLAFYYSSTDENTTFSDVFAYGNADFFATQSTTDGLDIRITNLNSRVNAAGGMLAIKNIDTSPYLPSYIYDGKPAGWNPSTFNPNVSHYFDYNFDGVPLTIYWDNAGECKPNATLFAESDYDSGTGKCLAVYQNPSNLNKGFVLYKSADGKHTYMIYQNL